MRTLLVSLIVLGTASAAAPPSGRMLVPAQKARLKELLAVYVKAAGLLTRNEYDETILLIEKALPIERELFGTVRPFRTDWVNWLARQYEDRGRFADARRLWDESAAALAHLPPDHWRVVEVRYHRAAGERLARLTAADRERLARAAELYQAGTRISARQAPEAVKLFGECLAIRLELLGEDNRETAEALLHLAMAAKDAGDWAVGPGHRFTARAQVNFASFLDSIGDHEAAHAMHRESLETRKNVVGTGDPEYQQGALNLAVSYHRARRHAEALPLYREVLAFRENRFGPEAFEVAAVVNNLGMLHLHRLELDKAEPLLLRARDIRKKHLGEKSLEYLESLNNIGGLRLERGDPDGALELFESLAVIRRERFGERSAAYATVVRNIACARQARGELDEARAAADRALAITRGLLELAAQAQSERQQLSQALTMRYQFNLRLSLGGDEHLYEHALAWKGAVLLRQQQARRRARLLATEKGAEARDLLDELERATRALVASSLLPDRIKETARLTREKEALEQRLSSLNADFTADRVTPDSLRKGLPADAVLIDYLFYTHQGVKDRRPTREPRLLAWVMRRDMAPVRVELGSATVVEGLVADWQQALSRGETPSTEELARLIWRPLAKHLKGVKTVLISPDHALGSFGFATLPGARKGSYLLEDLALVQVPAPQLLPALLTVEAGKGASSLLLVGDVAFGKDRPAWRELPATRGEVAAVTAAFRKRFEAEAKITPLSRERATLPAVRAALPGARFAHLATHGFFTPRDTPDWSPLLGSGVVLAGADGTLTALEIAEMDLSGMELAVLSACETGLGKLTGAEGLLGLQRSLQVAGCRRVISSLWSVEDAATSVLMERFYHHLWERKLSSLEALRQAQLDVLRGPGLVEARLERLRADLGKRDAALLRGLGKVSTKLPAGERRSPPAWWAAWQLAGDWR